MAMPAEKSVRDNEINQIIRSGNHRVGIIYDFVSVCTNMINVSKHYKDDIHITVIEARTIIEIVEHPGTTATELCTKWKRSRGALSQLLKKLEQKGMILKEKKPGNDKEIGLFPTNEGIRFYHAFIRNEFEDTAQIWDKLLNYCTPEELIHFYKVVECYTKVLVDNPEIQWRTISMNKTSRLYPVKQFYGKKWSLMELHFFVEFA